MHVKTQTSRDEVSNSDSTNPGSASRPSSLLADSPLAGLSVSIIGTGRVGESLGHWLQAGGACIRSVSARRRPSQNLLAKLDATFQPLDTFSSGLHDVLLLATPDASLSELALALSQRPQAKVVLHVSGPLDAEVLSPLRRMGCAIGTLHPLRAFAEPSHDILDAGSTFFALDGDADALELGQRLVDAWQGSASVIPAEARGLYHFAATLAAGGVVTLMSIVEEITRHLELPPSVMQGYLALAQGALGQVESSGEAGSAITGPAARDDRQTLDIHRQHLEQHLPHLVPIFEMLTRETQRQVETYHQRSSSATMP